MDMLDPDVLQRLDAADSDDKAFEDFCWALVNHEVNKRHIDPELDGPSPAKRSDGGHDIRLEIRARPRIPRSEFQPTLTPDALGEVWYSCKTGKSWTDEITRPRGPPSKAGCANAFAI